MENKNCISRSEVELFLLFLVDRGALSSYLKWCAEYSSDFCLLFSRKNNLIPAEYFIVSAFPWSITPDSRRWVKLHNQWLLCLKNYRSIKK